MAIADIYDALDSKHLYEEKMSFDETDKDIREVPSISLSVFI